MFLITRKFFNYLLGTFFTYLIYFFPFDVLFYFIFNKPILQIFSIISSFLFYLIIILYFKNKVSNTFFRVIIFEGMGIGFISLCVITLMLVVKTVTKINQEIIGMTALALISILVLYGLINANSIRLKRLNFFSKKLKKRVKIIFLSDLHLGSNSKNHLIKVIDIIQSLRSDVVIIGGDLLDSDKFNFNDLAEFKTLNKPIFFVTGNHELYLKNWKKIKNKLNDFNIKLIDGQSVKFHEINLIGVGDGMLESQKNNIKNHDLISNVFNLIIVHKPLLWKYYSNQIDLMLSGHTHNGQIFPFNLLVKIKFPNIYGLYKKDDSNLYVSSGVGCWGPKIRIGSENEIIDITISNKR